MIPALAAVGAVVVVIVILLLVNGHPDSGPTPTVQSPPAGSTDSPSTASPHEASPAPGTPARAAKAPVRVLNNSTRHGLAHRVAAQIRARGWRVVAVGNQRGRLPATTLYYSSGERAAARHLAREFPAIQRIAPATAGRPATIGLTLVLTRYWHQ